jgi:V/A-type H+/Na+-transporting ATPase subunit F
MKYKIAIVGSKEAIAGFTLLGADTVAVENSVDAIAKLFELKKKRQHDENGIERQLYAIVFITEDLLTAMTPDDEKKLSKGALPAIIPIPSHKGSTGYSLVRLQRIVERAIGSNILQ